MQLLKRLSETAGIPGREEATRVMVREALSGHVDGISVDRLGNVIARKKGAGPKVAVAAHMDEIGFLVSHVDEETGFLRINPAGGFDPRTLIAQRVAIHARGGPIYGLIGIKPVHILTEEERKKTPEMKDLFADIGLSGKEAKEQVRVGDPVTLVQTFGEVGDLITGKALDDRVGVYIGIEAMKKLRKHKADVYFVATVQEEETLGGALTSAYQLRPDLAIAIDVTWAKGPGTPDHQAYPMGEGITLGWGPNIHPGVYKAVKEIADKFEIPHKLETLPRHSGTDAYALQIAREGIPTMVISIPLRYMHTPVEVISLKDVKRTGRLLAEFVASLDLDVMDKLSVDN